MIERLRKLILLLAITTLVGCNSSSEETTTYFGGKIVNPKSKEVYLYFNDDVIDTLFLDKHNKFIGELKNIEEGLYYFKHGNEYQYLFLEPEDSLLLRLNSWDFDESLVFSGKGALRNNLLIDSFLDEEKERKRFYDYYHLAPHPFKQKIDSIVLSKKRIYDEFVLNNPKESESFLRVLKIALTYPTYGHVENYIMTHNELEKDNIKLYDIGDDFYSHRKDIDLGLSDIMHYSPYRNFVINYMHNEVYSKGIEIHSDEFTVDLMNTISKDIDNEFFKNRILRQTMLRHFYRRSSCNYDPDTFETYFSLSTNDEDIELVHRLLEDIQKLHKGKKLYNFDVTDYNHTSHSIYSIIKRKNALVYFWNSEYTSKEYLESRIRFLSSKLPNVKFIVVKINGAGKKRLQNIDIKDQYYLSKKSKAHTFLSSELPRALIISKNGALVNGFAYLYSGKTYKQLKSLEKK